MIDINGSVKHLYTYGPFGKKLEFDSDPDDLPNSFQFTGQYFDTETGDYHLRARTYSPALQRFTSRDPYLGQLEEPATLHAYLYCLNNPINRIDPFGEYSLLEQESTSAIQTGMHAYGAYSTAQTIKGYAQQLKDGVGIRSVFYQASIDLALTVGPGAGLKLLGKTGKVVGRFIKSGARKKVTNLHHAWPKFLGGVVKGNTIKIPKKAHVKFHDTLYKRLQKKFGKSCRSWSTETWDDFLADPDNRRIMWQELIDTTTELDNKLGGVDVMATLLDQMAEQL